MDTDADLEKQQGDAAYEQRDYSSAVSHYEKVTSLISNDPDELGKLAKSYFHTERYDMAETIARKAIDIGDGHQKLPVKAYVALILCMDHKKNYNSMIDYSTELLNKSTGSMNKAIALEYVGISYQHLKNYDTAISALNNSLALDPGRIMALSHRAEIYIIQKKYAEALQDLRNLKLKDPSNKFAEGKIPELEKQIGIAANVAQPAASTIPIMQSPTYPQSQKEGNPSDIRIMPKSINGVQQVPIDAIFSIEFTSLGTLPLERSAIRARYEQYVAGLMDEISRCLKASFIDDIKAVDENKLFEFLADVFQRDFRVTFDDDKMITTSMLDNDFNCYSSAAILGDALARSGKPIHFVEKTGHILLAGDYYAFETRSRPEHAVYPIDHLDVKYPYHQELNDDGLLSAAYNWAGTAYKKRDKLNDALSCYDKSIKLNPKHANAWKNRGETLEKLGRNDEALESFEEATSADPHYAAAWKDQSDLLIAMGKSLKAMECLLKAEIEEALP